MRRNICIVSECQQVPGVGGTETVSFLLKEEFKKNGYNVFSLFFTQKTTLTSGDMLFPERDKIISNKNKKFLINTIKENHIDFILSQGTAYDDVLILCIEAKKITPVRLIYTNHFNPLMGIKDYDDYNERRIYRISNPIKKLLASFLIEIKRPLYVFNGKKSLKEKYSKYEIEQIDAFVSLNEEYSKFSSKIFASHYKDRFHTIANPIVIDNPTRNEIKENIVLFVGRLTSQKRLDRLMYIWNSICKAFPTWKLVVVGDGDYSHEYKRIARDLGLMNIEFVGQQPSEEYFKKSKIVCMTSSHEALPMVLIEAQKYRCVPIAYNSFDAAEDIIKNGHNGLLIKPFKQKEYAKALSKLMTDENYRESLAKNGSTFIEKFNIETVIKDWIKLLESL